MRYDLWHCRDLWQPSYDKHRIIIYLSLLFLHQYLVIMIFSPFLSVALALVASVHAAPSGQDWDSMNKTFGGRLRTVTPLALPCFSNFNGKSVPAQADLCSAIQRQYTSPPFLTDQFEAYEETQSEACATVPNQQCLLDSTNPFNAAAYTNVSCNRGSLPSYSIQVNTADDVNNAFKLHHAHRRQYPSRTRAMTIMGVAVVQDPSRCGRGSCKTWIINRLSFPRAVDTRRGSQQSRLVPA